MNDGAASPLDASVMDAAQPPGSAADAQPDTDAIRAGSWPVPDDSVPSPDAGTDPSCKLLLPNNDQGVGSNCMQRVREFTCPTTLTCTEALTLLGMPVPRPCFCSKGCATHADCGDMASCCAIPGLQGKACVLDSCSFACAKQ